MINAIIIAIVGINILMLWLVIARVERLERDLQKKEPRT